MTGDIRPVNFNIYLGEKERVGKRGGGQPQGEGDTPGQLHETMHIHSTITLLYIVKQPREYGFTGDKIMRISHLSRTQITTILHTVKIQTSRHVNSINDRHNNDVSMSSWKITMGKGRGEGLL
jgi:hypothetical protein